MAEHYSVEIRSQLDAIIAGIDGTNNIGSVALTKRNITSVVGTVSSLGNNTLVAQPGASARIRVLSWKFWNESTTPIKAILKTATINIDAYYMFTQGSGWIDKLDDTLNVVLAQNEALVLDLSAAGTVGYSIKYEVV